MTRKKPGKTSIFGDQSLRGNLEDVSVDPEESFPFQPSEAGPQVDYGVPGRDAGCADILERLFPGTISFGVVEGIPTVDALNVMRRTEVEHGRIAGAGSQDVRSVQQGGPKVANCPGVVPLAPRTRVLLLAFVHGIIPFAQCEVESGQL